METTYLTVQGMRIRTVMAGPAAAPPLVLLHGYPASSDLWRGCLPALAGRRRVYAPDLPGYGASDKPLDVRYDLDFYLRFLDGFADALGLERFALAGHDVGGMIVLGFAARRRDRLDRLVVLDTAPYAGWGLITSLLVTAARLRLLGPLLLGRSAFRRLLRMGVCRREAITPEVVEQYRSHWVASPEARRAFSAVVASTRWTLPLEELRSISTPTLVLWAARDVLFGPGIGKRLSQDIPGARLVVLPGCGHFLQEDDPAAVAGTIDAFLSETAQGEAAASARRNLARACTSPTA